MDRRARRCHIDSKLRKLRRLNNEYHELWRRSFERPVVPVEKPYIGGWRRIYVLRDDIANRKDANDIRQALALVNHPVYSPRKSFLVRDYKNGGWKPMDQGLRTISEKEYEAQTPKVRSYFQWYWHVAYRKVEVRYRFKYPHFFVFRVSPRWVYFREVPEGDVESREQEVRNYLYRDNLVRTIWHKIDHQSQNRDSWDRRGWKNRALDRRAKDEIRDFLWNYEGDDGCDFSTDTDNYND